MGSVKRTRIVVALAALGLLSGMLLSPQLWLPGRLYPYVPLIPNLSAPAWLEVVLAGATGLGALLLALTSRRRAAAIVVIALAALWLLDQSRLQPWTVQYAGMLLALTLWPARPARNDAAGLQVARLIVAASYFWSGIHKLGPQFAATEMPWFFDGIAVWLPASLPPPPQWLGYAAALTEIAIGVLLLIPLTRLIAVLLALGMHAFILAALGPWGHNWNSVVWPWNLFIAAIVVMLFLRLDRPKHVALLPRHAAALTLAGFFTLLPALNLFGWWDTYLSASLYSGNVHRGYITLEGEALANLPQPLCKYLQPFDAGQALDIMDWSFGELNVPAYPEQRIYLGIARELYRKTGNPDGFGLMILPRDTVLEPDPQPVVVSAAMLE